MSDDLATRTLLMFGPFMNGATVVPSLKEIDYLLLLCLMLKGGGRSPTKTVTRQSGNRQFSHPILFSR